MVSKAQILAGVRYHEPLYVPELERDGCGGEHDSCDGIVQVRPLSDGEQGEVDVALSAGQSVVTEVGRDRERPRRSEIDVAESARGQQRARRIGVAYGLSVDDETWTPQEVATLPPRAVARIMRKVRELTGGRDTSTEAAASDDQDADIGEGEGQEVGDDEPARFRTHGDGTDDRDPAPDRPSAGADTG